MAARILKISGFQPEMIRTNVDPCEAAAVPRSDRIVAVKVPDAGLGLAINDRLRRAAHEPSAVAGEGAA